MIISNDCLSRNSNFPNKEILIPYYSTVNRMAEDEDKQNETPTDESLLVNKYLIDQ